jgi:hypothetical protein
MDDTGASSLTIEIRLRLLDYNNRGDLMLYCPKHTCSQLGSLKLFVALASHKGRQPWYVAFLRNERRNELPVSWSINGHALRGPVGLPLIDVEETVDTVSAGQMLEILDLPKQALLTCIPSCHKSPRPPQ